MASNIAYSLLAVLIVFAVCSLLIFFAADEHFQRLEKTAERRRHQQVVAEVIRKLRRQGLINQNSARLREPADNFYGSAIGVTDDSAFSINGIIFPDSSSQLLLNVPEKFTQRYHLNGATFETKVTAPNKEGGYEWAASIKANKMFAGRHEIQTSLLYSFSPTVERRVAELFIDPNREQIYYANSPALFWDGDYPNGGRLIVVMRIWLGAERYDGDDKLPWPKNHFYDNYFFSQAFDRAMQPLDNGQIIGIPAHIGGRVGSGTIEPRLFAAFRRSDLFISYNTGIHNEKNQFVDTTLIWDYRNSTSYFPKINSPNPMFLQARQRLARDKHWMAFSLPPSSNTSKPVVYFVQSLEPLRIIECDVKFRCHIVYQVGSIEHNFFDDQKHHLRGGTPFVLYKWPYYIAVAHVTLFVKPWAGRYYTGNFVVLRADPASSPPFRIVYISYPIRVNEALMKAFQLPRYMYIHYPFLFPVGLMLENKDSAILGVHINDQSSVILRIQGLEKIMDDVIAVDSAAAEDKSAVKSIHQHGKDDKQAEDIVDVSFRYKNQTIEPNLFVRLAAIEESNLRFEVGVVEKREQETKPAVTEKPPKEEKKNSEKQGKKPAVTEKPPKKEKKNSEKQETKLAVTEKPLKEEKKNSEKKNKAAN